MTTTTQTSATAAIVPLQPAKLILRPEAIREAMKANNIDSIEQLAQILDIRPSTIKRAMMTGEAPSAALIAGLWTRLGLSPDKTTRTIDPTGRRR